MPDMPASILGLEARLYVGTVGATQSSLAVAANEVTCARSTDLSRTSTMADVTTRGSDYRLQRRALKIADDAINAAQLPSRNIPPTFETPDKPRKQVC